MYKHILIPTDGSERSGRALTEGAAFAAALGAKLTVVHVTRPLHSMLGEPITVGAMTDEARKFVHEYLTADAEAALSSAAAIAERAGISCDVVRAEDEHIYQGIIDIARERGCDLIAMASHGRSGLQAVVLSSETVKVLIHSKIPVLVYR
ncbi:MAG TPA: universal stress protein [Afifellaceae bacterium]|nr:universal stress protein [Afifellaceae bacterium]